MGFSLLLSHLQKEYNLIKTIVNVYQFISGREKVHLLNVLWAKTGEIRVILKKYSGHL